MIECLLANNIYDEGMIHQYWLLIRVINAQMLHNNLSSRILPFLIDNNNNNNNNAIIFTHRNMNFVNNIAAIRQINSHNNGIDRDGFYIN